jgi:hypothetical protein
MNETDKCIKVIYYSDCGSKISVDICRPFMVHHLGFFMKNVYSDQSEL